MTAKKRTTKKPSAESDEVDLSWYSRERYGESATLDLMGWWQVLAYRKLVLKQDELSIGFRAICQDPLAPRVAPIADEPPVTNLHPTEALDLAAAYSEPEYAERIVQWVEARGAGTRTDQLLNQIFGGAPGLRALPDIHSHSLQKLIDGGGPDSVMGYFVMTAHLKVDLHASDEVLTAWFCKWLREERALLDQAKVIWRRPIRRGRGGKGKFTSAECKQWTRLRVLDYIDIQIASRVQGRDMPTAQRIGAFLFPDQATVDTTDLVRQQVKQTADLLTSRHFLDALHTQVVAERMLELARA